ncbi:MAG: hypothetical protein A2015_06445 [Spirochaetes bacterium GWF1_31_7]|nr:MAG: hypothetical protein A2Y30_08280 [Spirochaetes bacterium GWE1_32_154]OHD51384.1 MAG: hypothetical protein A2Y29_14665 [Spirochaetes bacterium GWE2_31_10]OHD53110.1 MAG: hypothetical protein A2015_06445 [Spirochaetes bacterium GWF1_31_7]HBD94469.1 NAD(P)/FAD-dependent oxidoreductase [Spirochaetia bacterium]HBI36114.1 NAD(P)/FAD-dependent oxidoreductase [Spirochaetia bacterium]
MDTTLSFESYDAVIIGAGIGGLVCGTILAKAGLKVHIVEMDTHVGGYVTCFDRNQFRFEASIHWLNQCGPEGIVRRTLDYIAPGFPEMKPMTRIKRYKGDSFDYTLSSDPEDFKNRLLKEFPDEKKGIIKMFKAARKCGLAMVQVGRYSRCGKNMTIVDKLMYFIKTFSCSLVFMRYFTYSASKGLELFFKNPDIKKIFSAENKLLSILVPIGWAYLGDYQLLPEGGSQIIPDRLKNVFEKTGGTISFNAKAEKVLLTGKTADGVTFVQNGERKTIKGKYIIVASDIDTLYQKMLPEGTIHKKILNQVHNAELFSSAVTVSLGFDCPASELGFGEEMITLTRDDVTRAEGCTTGDPNKIAFVILSPSERDKTLAPAGKGSLCIFAPALIEYSNYWKTGRTPDGEFIRNDEYKKFKKEYADILIDRVCKVLSPKLREHIVFCDVATPITYLRYTGNKDGSIMATKPEWDNIKSGNSQITTPVKNLFLSGHWAALGGGIPIALKAAVNCAYKILEKEHNSEIKNIKKILDDNK